MAFVKALFIFVYLAVSAQECFTAALNSSKGGTTSEGYVFNNVYNSGLSTSQAQQILKRLAEVERQLGNLESRARCPPGWKEFNNSCFVAFIKPTATWDEARFVCLSLGGDLAKITSAAENNYVYGMISGNLASLVHVWSGLHRAKDGKFYWPDGSSLASFSSWDSGEPNNIRSAENCGVFYRGESSPGKWHDTSCSVKSGFICQIINQTPI